MGRIFIVDLQGPCFQCRHCKTPVARAEDVLSRSFNCSRGRAFLFSEVVNVTFGEQLERLLTSGLHTVEDIFCCFCGQILGWKYVVAHDKNETYKEGKCILERWRIVEYVPEESNVDANAGPSASEAENNA
ncbi:protein yippee-like At5g53940 [Lotus japonicus]|uniref:protein yippee-like At5g53940 n=1 Tax=Lotus japonicus TaxID=34305 RepID=UPI0025890DCF|nr:protein yippee-like At5g53940 [Lotus japonicus]